MSYQETKSEAETSEAKKPSPRKLPIIELDQEWDEPSDIDVAVVVCDGKIAYLLRRGLASDILSANECLTNDQIEHTLRQIVNASDSSFTRTMQALRLARTPTDRKLEYFAALTEQEKKNKIYPKFCDRKHKNEFKSTVSDLTSDQLMRRLEKDEQFSRAFQIELVADLLFDQHVKISVGTLMNLATDGATINLFGQAAGTPKTMRKTKIIGKVFATDSGVKEALQCIRIGRNDVTHKFFKFEEYSNRQIYLQNYLLVLENVDFRSCFPHLGSDLQAKINEYLVPGIETHQHQQIVSCFDGWRKCNEKVVERYGQSPSDAWSQLEMIQKKYPGFQLVYEVSKRAAIDALQLNNLEIDQKLAEIEAKHQERHKEQEANHQERHKEQEANHQARHEEQEANYQARQKEQEANDQARHEQMMEQLRKQPPMVVQDAPAVARLISPSQDTEHLGQADADDLSDPETDACDPKSPKEL